MKKNYTHLVLLIDRSGSMISIKEDMEGGIKTFIDSQKLESGDCTVTAAQFDNEYELIFNRQPISEVDEIKINPRGATALIDSMCRLINDVGTDLAALPEDERPDRVLFITITDGEENSSLRFTSADLKKSIKAQEDEYNWNFTYIGANQDAFKVSSDFGGRFNNSMSFVASPDGVDKMFSTLSNATSRYRSYSSNLSASSFNYTEDELKNK